MKYTKKDREMLETVRSYIVQHYAEKILVEDLCRLVGLNEIKLSKGFKDFYQKTIIQYQIDLRMQLAADLLKTDKIIKEVATQVGYQDWSKFSPHFKKQFGLTPTQYKQRYTE